MRQTEIFLKTNNKVKSRSMTSPVQSRDREWSRESAVYM